MRTHGLIACLLTLGAFAPRCEAAQFTVTDVPSIASAGEIKPHDIAFAELDHDEATNPVGKHVTIYVFAGWPFKGATVRTL